MCIIITYIAYYINNYIYYILYEYVYGNTYMYMCYMSIMIHNVYNKKTI